MSSRLTSESRIYADKAKDLNRQVSLIAYYLILHNAVSIHGYKIVCMWF